LRLTSRLTVDADRPKWRAIDRNERTPMLGGQLAIGIAGLFSRADASISGTLTAQLGSIAATRMGTISDSLTSVGDLSPFMTLKWRDGVPKCC